MGVSILYHGILAQYGRAERLLWYVDESSVSHHRILLE